MGVGNASIDIEKLEQAIKWFAKYVAIKQKSKSVVFYSGFMEVNEGYKRV